jgi:hypothetical protein
MDSLILASGEIVEQAARRRGMKTQDVLSAECGLLRRGQAPLSS